MSYYFHIVYICVCSIDRTDFYTCLFSLDCNPHPVSLYRGRLPEPRTVGGGHWGSKLGFDQS
jgi:hypothetical protein